MILETLTCVVQRIIYRSHESGYAVIKVTVHGYRRLVPLIGELLEVQLASSIIVQGLWKTDPLYGRQFEVHKWKEVLPADLNSLERFIGSGVIRGIGPAMAKRFVSRFGLRLIDVLENHPDELLKVSGVGVERAKQIHASWIEHRKIISLVEIMQEMENGGCRYKIHDKVLHNRNNYTKEVFNGDTGVVVEVDEKSQSLIVDYQGRKVTYTKQELDELELSYALTIHKAQGSEYAIVVIPLFREHQEMWNRQLLYTAITRAKKIVVLVGSREVLKTAVETSAVEKRDSYLYERLIEKAK